MPRQKRVDEAAVIHHAINRGNARQAIFMKHEDYESFLRVLSEGLEKYPVDVFSFTLMPNHWHLALRQLSQASGGLDVRVALTMASDDGTSSENPFTIAHHWPSKLDQPGQ